MNKTAEEGYRPIDKLDISNPPHDGSAKISHFLKPKDPINPDYYKVGGIEQIEYNRSRMTAEQFEGWLLGDLMNYIGRYNHKFTGLEQIVDLKKAQWYLIELIKLKEAQLNE